MSDLTTEGDIQSLYHILVVIQATLVWCESGSTSVSMPHDKDIGTILNVGSCNIVKPDSMKCHEKQH